MNFGQIKDRYFKNELFSVQYLVGLFFNPYHYISLIVSNYN